MARWNINRHRKGIKVTYTNFLTGATSPLGPDQHPDTSMRLIIEWAAEHADSGDLVMMNGKFVAQKFPQAEA